ncbi:hypothetical protein AB9Q52_011165 [Pantoea vagans]|uniref:hypothetical protein n=1 Tax=Pantoea vagans TaxID=470934 RepID=UPI0035153375
MEDCKISISLVSLILAAWLALERFYKEKWWERRANAFTSQIEAAYLLYRVLRYQHEKYQYEKKSSALPGFILLKENDEMVLHKQFIHSLAELEKYQYLGRFISSEKSADMIRVFFNDFNELKPKILKEIDELLDEAGRIAEEKAKQETLKKTEGLAKKLLADLTEEAKNELKIKGFFLKRIFIWFLHKGFFGR